MKDAEGDVLIVDDEPDICWALDHIMKCSGIASVAVSNGSEALRLAKERRFRLILVDAKLPDLDGLDVARLIRGADGEVRIVLVSGYFYSNDPDVQQALRTSVIDGFIGKPIRHEEVVAVTKETFAR